MHRKGGGLYQWCTGMDELTLKINEFLKISSGSGSSYGYGYGSGYGSNYGYGYGDGYGSGYGSSYGYGDGDGDGDGYGDGSGVKNINSMTINNIDSIQTAILQVRGNVAKGFILQRDLTLKPCYVVKQDNYFAHGETLREAQQALRDKLFEEMDEDDRIDAFLNEFKANNKYPAKSFYDWHNRLTGSCKMGRDTFVQDKGIDLENDNYTVSEFIKITQGSYGSDIIKRIKERIK